MPLTIFHATGTTCVFPVIPGMFEHEMLPVGVLGVELAAATVTLVDAVPLAPLTE
jgi:hypothetical protein